MSGTPKQNYLYSPPSYTSSSNTMTVVVADAIESTIYIVDLDRSDHEQLMLLRLGCFVQKHTFA